MKSFSIYYDENNEASVEMCLRYKDMLVEHNYTEDSERPDFVISIGGDGNLLKSEYEYPSVPKLFIKNTKIGKLGQNKKNDEVLDLFIKGKYFLKSFDKLEAFIKNTNTKIIASSEVVVHNKDPRNAIRFKMRVDEDEIHHELIGDGLIVCNPLGSTGYYKSITGSFFEVGTGVAFNNTTEPADHMVLNSNRKVQIEITRGPAICFADNQEGMHDLYIGDVVEIVSNSESKFNLIRVYDDVFEGNS